jgi:hypothetical protein
MVTCRRILLRLCPDACTAVKADGGAKVDVLFTCDSTIIVPK